LVTLGSGTDAFSLSATFTLSDQTVPSFDNFIVLGLDIARVLGFGWLRTMPLASARTVS
jgi:hypothetical protein